jgi:hypothetical protein
MKTHKSEFRKLVSEFSENYSKIEDTDFAKQELIKFKNSLIENQLTRTEILKGFTNNLAGSALYVGFPAFIGCMAGAVFTSPDDILEIIEIAKGLLVGGVATMFDARRTVLNWDKRKSNYYLDVRKNLTSEKDANITYRRIDRYIEEFIND